MWSVYIVPKKKKGNEQDERDLVALGGVDEGRVVHKVPTGPHLDFEVRAECGWEKGEEDCKGHGRHRKKKSNLKN
jgi:hypothetical protein